MTSTSPCPLSPSQMCTCYWPIVGLSFLVLYFEMVLVVEAPHACLNMYYSWINWRIHTFQHQTCLWCIHSYSSPIHSLASTIRIFQNLKYADLVEAAGCWSLLFSFLSSNLYVFNSSSYLCAQNHAVKTKKTYMSGSIQNTFNHISYLFIMQVK